MAGVMSEARFISYVALLRDKTLAPSTVTDWLGSLFPQMNLRPEIMASPRQEPKEPSFILKIWEMKFLIWYKPHPLPSNVFIDDPVQNLWDNWRDMARRQRAHYIVSNLEMYDEHPKKLAAAIIVLIITTAIAQELDPAGIYWVPSELFLGAESFIRGNRHLLPKTLPITYLVKPRWYKDERCAQDGLITQGLANFVDREIDYPSGNEDEAGMWNRALNLATYLIVNGPVIKNGDTIGSAEEERISVHLAERNGTPTYRLTAAEAGVANR